jgi:hypothetical protein
MTKLTPKLTPKQRKRASKKANRAKKVQAAQNG